MATTSDVSIINWNTAEAKPVASGLERTICSRGLCGSKTLTVHQRTVLEGRQFDVQAGDDYHLIYVIEAPKEGIISLNGKSHAAEEGAGVLLAPGESARFEASGSKLELLHMAHGGPIDYFEIQAWRSFKTDVLSEEPLGLKWYYDPVTPGAARVEWDQS